MIDNYRLLNLIDDCIEIADSTIIECRNYLKRHPYKSKNILKLLNNERNKSSRNRKENK